MLERAWNDLKRFLPQSNRGVLSPLQFVAELQKFDEIKIADVERRLLGTVRPPKVNNRVEKQQGPELI